MFLVHISDQPHIKFDISWICYKKIRWYCIITLSLTSSSGLPLSSVANAPEFKSPHLLLRFLAAFNMIPWWRLIKLAGSTGNHILLSKRHLMFCWLLNPSVLMATYSDGYFSLWTIIQLTPSFMQECEIFEPQCRAHADIHPSSPSLAKENKNIQRSTTINQI